MKLYCLWLSLKSYCFCVWLKSYSLCVWLKSYYLCVWLKSFSHCAWLKSCSLCVWLKSYFLCVWQIIFCLCVQSRFKLADQSLMFDEEARPYRWFLLPSEANQILCGSTPMVPCMPSDLPFCPPELQERWTMGQEMQDVEWTVVNGQTASARSADDSDVWVEAEHGMEEQKSETVIGGKKASCQKEGSSDLHTTSSARLCQDIHSSAEKNTSDNSIQESGGSLPSQVTQSSQPHHPQQSENSHESAASSVDVGADGSASCDGFPHVVQTAMERGYWDNASSCSGPASISLHGDCEVRTVLPHTDPEPVFGPAAAVQEGSAWAPGHRHGDASAERSESTRESLSPKQSPPVLADSDRNCRGEPLTTKTTPSAADATIITGICTLESTRSPKKGADRELHVEEGTSNPGTQQTGSGEHGTESTSNPGTQQTGSGEHGTESTSNPGTQQAGSGEHGTESTSNPGTQQTGSGEHGTESTSNPGTQQAGSGEHGTESTSNQGMQQARSGDSNPGAQQARSGEPGPESTSNPGAQQARSGEPGPESTSNPGAQQARSGRKGTKSTSNPGTQQARSGDSNQGMQLARSGRKGRESTSNPGAQQTRSGRKGRESTSNPGVQQTRSGRKGRESTSNPGVQQTRSGRKGRESTSNPGAQQARSGDSNQGMQQARSGRKGRECGRQWVPPTKEIFKLSVKVCNCVATLQCILFMSFALDVFTDWWVRRNRSQFRNPLVSISLCLSNLDSRGKWISLNMVLVIFWLAINSYLRWQIVFLWWVFFGCFCLSGINFVFFQSPVCQNGY